MVYFKKLFVLLIASGSSLAANSAASISSAFQVDLSSNNEGGCGYAGEDLLNKIFSDCLKLAETGVDAVDRYGQDDKATRMLDAYFGENSGLISDQLSDIASIYSEVRDWIVSPGNVDGGASTAKPWLFCFHSWLQAKDMNSEAQDQDGDLIQDQVTGDNVKIGQVPKYERIQRERQEAENDAAAQDRRRPVKIIPYFSYKHKEYLFDMSYGGVNRGFCSNAGHFAAVSHDLSTSTLTLCPVALGATNSARNPSYRGLHHANLSPQSRDDVVHGTIPSNAQSLQNDVLPTATTIFHELFHLILGNDDTTPDGYPFEQYGLEDILGMPFNSALGNPETFALVAVGYDYALHSDSEFYPGYAVR